MIGGVNINPQIAQLKKPVDILVATPGRLLDHIQQKTLSLSQIEILVLDEADRMLDMGFIRDIKKILALLPKQRQNLLFSATFSDEIQTLADNLLNKPVLIEVARRNAIADKVSHMVHPVDRKRKRDLLVHLIKQHSWSQVLVFTRTKHGANKLTKQLNEAGITAAAIHGNKSQGARTKALAEFKQNVTRILVATDIAARGLDIPAVTHVFNFDVPSHAEDYVHRIGRTGRAGRSGTAIMICTGRDEKNFADVERLVNEEIPRLENPTATAKPADAPAEDAPKAEAKPRTRSRTRKPREDKPAEDTKAAPVDAAPAPEQEETPREEKPRGRSRGGRGKSDDTRNAHKPQEERGKNERSNNGNDRGRNNNNSNNNRRNDNRVVGLGDDAPAFIAKSFEERSKS